MSPARKSRASAPPRGGVPDRPPQASTGAPAAAQAPPSPSPEPPLGNHYGSCCPLGATESPANGGREPFLRHLAAGEYDTVPGGLWALQRTAAKWWPAERVTYCGHPRQRWPVEVCRRAGNADLRHWWRGWARCGDPWLCPVCGLAISLARRGQVEAAVAAHLADGGRVAMATLTLPHRAGDDLEQLLDTLHGAARRMREWRAWRRLAGDVQLRGTITAREATWGQRHGWHPHLHALLLIGGDVAGDALERRLAPLWRRAVERAGGRTPGDHGCRVSVRHDAEAPAQAAAYVTAGPWGVGDELTGAARKQARASRYSPRDLLTALHRCDRQERMRAARQWRARLGEYVDAYRGRHVLTWSKGLKRELGVRRIDDQAAADELPEALVTAVLGPRAARVVHAEGLAPALLHAADREGWTGVQKILAAYGLQVGVTAPPMFEALGAMTPFLPCHPEADDGQNGGAD